MKAGRVRRGAAIEFCKGRFVINADAHAVELRGDETGGEPWGLLQTTPLRVVIGTRFTPFVTMNLFSAMAGPAQAWP